MEAPTDGVEQLIAENRAVQKQANEEFFAAELADPVRLLSLSKSLRRLSSRQLELLEQLVQEMK